VHALFFLPVACLHVYTSVILSVVALWRIKVINTWPVKQNLKVSSSNINSSSLVLSLLVG